MNRSQWAAASSPSVTLVNLAGQVNIADMTLRPGDGQPLFPSVNVITCSSTVVGVVIRDFIKFGGGSQNNSCPGAIELGGSGGLFTEGATGGDEGNGTINLSSAYFLNGSKVGTIATVTAAMTTSLIGAGACGSTVTVAASGVATTDAIQHSFNASIAANPGVLTVVSWPTANNVNFEYCNPTAGGVTPQRVRSTGASFDDRCPIETALRPVMKMYFLSPK